MSGSTGASKIALELTPEAAELIARKGRQGQRALAIDWLHGSC